MGRRSASSIEESGRHTRGDEPALDARTPKAQVEIKPVDQQELLGAEAASSKKPSKHLSTHSLSSKAKDAKQASIGTASLESQATRLKGRDSRQRILEQQRQKKRLTLNRVNNDRIQLNYNPSRASKNTSKDQPYKSSINSLAGSVERSAFEPNRSTLRSKDGGTEQASAGDEDKKVSVSKNEYAEKEQERPFT